jgi:glyoxylase-like metal-dependent hydrolase (beta-lactamase superfamily II)
MRAFSSWLTGLTALTGCILAAWVGGETQKTQAIQEKQIPAMKFNDVVEMAPGVFFRYSSISATDMSVPFGGCNNIWVVFKDHVAVIDANFPKEAEDVVAAIRKTTDKPIKFVLDTHHHGDHAYGNTVWAREGAKVVGHVNCSRLLETNGPKQWEEASKGRKDIAENKLKTVDIPFDEKYVLDDGTQRLEFHFLGHAHTPGDAVAWLPKHRILCTGDACVNGAFNFMGHSNSASWVRVLDRMAELDPEVVLPGHGKPSPARQLIALQRRYFADMRDMVKKGIDANKTLEEITASCDMPWYKEWTGKDAQKIPENIAHVHKEMLGKIDHKALGSANRPESMGPYGTEPVRVAGR